MDIIHIKYEAFPLKIEILRLKLIKRFSSICRGGTIHDPGSWIGSDRNNFQVYWIGSDRIGNSKKLRSLSRSNNLNKIIYITCKKDKND